MKWSWLCPYLWIKNLVGVSEAKKVSKKYAYYNTLAPKTRKNKRKKA